jgi:hypothetical protein
MLRIIADPEKSHLDALVCCVGMAVIVMPNIGLHTLGEFCAKGTLASPPAR